MKLSESVVELQPVTEAAACEQEYGWIAGRQSKDPDAREAWAGGAVNSKLCDSGTRNRKKRNDEFRMEAAETA